MNFTEAVNLAKKGDEEGYTYLYEQTYSKALYVAIKYVKQEDRAYDVLQDAYIKAFKSLEQLEKPEKFVSWFHMIVARTALNDLKKKSPMLFTEFERDDERFDISNMFRDEYTDNQPELVIEKKETSRIVQEIIDTLSDEQRTCVTMYYIDEFSVKEIAETIEVSENTVKSRLNYARKKIEDKVKMLESQGTKLYGLAPVPFFVLLMKKELAIKVAQGVSTQTYMAAMASIGVKSNAAIGASASTAATKTGGIGIKLFIATATTVAVVSTGAWGYSQLSKQEEPELTVTADDNSDVELLESEKAEKDYEDFLSNQTLLTGKEYGVYLEYDEQMGDRFTGDSFYNGIVAHTVEDVDSDGINELVIVEGKETGELSLCLLGYDEKNSKVVRLDEQPIEPVPTDAQTLISHWSIIKGDQVYLLYDYYYGYYEPGYRGFCFMTFSDDKIDRVAEFNQEGSSWGDEPQTDYDTEIRKVFQHTNQSVNEEQLSELEYNANFLDYIEGNVFGKIETVEVSSWEEISAWQENRSSDKNSLKVSIGKIQ